jgi:hypothetical protein
MQSALMATCVVPSPLMGCTHTHTHTHTHTCIHECMYASMVLMIFIQLSVFTEGSCDHHVFCRQCPHILLFPMQKLCSLDGIYLSMCHHRAPHTHTHTHTHTISLWQTRNDTHNNQVDEYGASGLVGCSIGEFLTVVNGRKINGYNDLRAAIRK